MNMDILKYIDSLLDSGLKDLKALKNIKNRRELFTLLSIIRYAKGGEKNGMRKKPWSTCLADEDIALFIDKKAGYDGYDRVVRHIAECDECLDKILEVKMLLNQEGYDIPAELAERAFRKAEEEKSRRGGYIIRFKRIAVPLAAAASIVVISLFAFYRSFNYTGKVDSVEDQAGPEIEATKIEGIRLTGTYAKGIPHKHFRGNRILHAGYLYFLLRNADSDDTKLLMQFYHDLSGSGLDPLESIYLITQRRFDFFQMRISSLPEKERRDFYEGYILSLLFYSDENGALNDKRVARGKKLVLHASNNEIREYMLYQR
jgi:hypothetical protein